MEAKHIKVVLFSRNADRAKRLQTYFDQNVLFDATLDRCPPDTMVEEIFLRYTPNLVLIDFCSFRDEVQEQLMRKFERVADTIPLVGIFQSDQHERALSYVKRGIRDFIEVPLNDQDLTHVLQRFQSLPAVSPSTVSGKVHTFFSFKGGVGTTFLAVNTAVSLARETKQRVLLWDMSLHSGDIPFFLNLKPEYTMSELLENLDQLDEAYLEGVLRPHATGISILPAPERIEDVEQLTPDKVEKVLTVLLPHFDHIVIDAGYHLTEALVPLMDAASNLFIPSTHELVSLRRTARGVEVLERLNYSPEKMKMIINRFNSKYENIQPGRARDILRYAIVHQFPNDYETASSSVRLGEAVAVAAKGSKLDKHFRAFSRKIVKQFKENGSKDYPLSKRMFGKITNAFTRRKLEHATH